MRRLPWPQLLLAGLLGATLGVAALLITWDPTTPFQELEVTAAHVDRSEQHCSRSTAGPVGGPTVCSRVLYFRSDEGREFFFPFADELPGLGRREPVELGHSRGGEIWFVRQGDVMVASYDHVRELRDHGTRILRFFGLLACAAMAALGGRTGIQRVRAGPPSSSWLCRLLDHVALAALVVAVGAIALQRLSVALAATVSVFLAFMGGIYWATGEDDIAVAPFEANLLSGRVATSLRTASARFDEWGDGLFPSKGSLTLPWRLLAWGRALCGLAGSLMIFGGILITSLFVVVAGEDDQDLPRVMLAWVASGVVLLLVGGLLGRLLRLAGDDGSGGTGWSS